MTDTATMEYNELLKGHYERVKKYEDEYKQGKDEIDKMLQELSKKAEQEASIIASTIDKLSATIYLAAAESAITQMRKDGMKVIEGIYNRSMESENLIMFGVTELYGAK